MISAVYTQSEAEGIPIIKQKKDARTFRYGHLIVQE